MIERAFWWALGFFGIWAPDQWSYPDPEEESE